MTPFSRTQHQKRRKNNSEEQAKNPENLMKECDLEHRLLMLAVHALVDLIHNTERGVSDRL
jgi:hypothetical protein